MYDVPAFITSKRVNGYIGPRTFLLVSSFGPAKAFGWCTVGVELGSRKE